jgi:hypothetical protein
MILSVILELALKRLTKSPVNSLCVLGGARFVCGFTDDTEMGTRAFEHSKFDDRVWMLVAEPAVIPKNARRKTLKSIKMDV